MTQKTEVSPFEGSLPDDPGRYLGNIDTVDLLVRNFVHDIAMAASMDEFMAVVDKTAEIFCGMNPDYQTIPDWNTRLQLGVVICERMEIDHSQDWETIMRAALMKTGLEVRGYAAKNADDSEEDWRWAIDALIEFWTSMLIGTVDLTHPTDEA